MIRHGENLDGDAAYTRGAAQVITGPRPVVTKHRCLTPGCGQDFATRAELNAHKANAHPDEGVAVPNYSHSSSRRFEMAPAGGEHHCTHPGCKRTFASEHAMKIHIGRSHQGASPADDQAPPPPPSKAPEHHVEQPDPPTALDEQRQEERAVETPADVWTLPAAAPDDTAPTSAASVLTEQEAEPATTPRDVDTLTPPPAPASIIDRDLARGMLPAADESAVEAVAPDVSSDGAAAVPPPGVRYHRARIVLEIDERTFTVGAPPDVTLAEKLRLIAAVVAL